MKIYPYFENQQDVVIANLKKARREVTILMAWLNFDVYGDVFAALLGRGVHLRILLDDNQFNRGYQKIIENLRRLGAEIFFFQFSGTMHMKDAVFDDNVLLTGSFNWTKNANLRNIERLEVQEAENICDKAQLVEVIRQYYRNCLISTKVVNVLKKVHVCVSCGSPKVVLAIPTEEDYYNTTFSFFECCQCGTRRIAQVSYPVYVWETKNEIIDQYEENEKIYYDRDERKAVNRILDAKLEMLYIDLFQNFSMDGMPAVHGIAEIAYRSPKFDDGSAYCKVIWKYHEIKDMVLDEYDMSSLI